MRTVKEVYLKMNFLTHFYQQQALEMVENCTDYVSISDDLVMILADDGTVWMCQMGKCEVNLRRALLIQRIL